MSLDFPGIADLASRLNATSATVARDLASEYANLRNAYVAHRVEVVSGANALELLRHSAIAGALAVTAFVLLTVPRNMRSLTAFFDQFMRKDPLPAYRAGGVTDADIARTRRVIFFYFLYMAYQLVQFPFTHWSEGPIPLYADALIQVALLVLLIRSFGNLKADFRSKWRQSAAAMNEDHEKRMSAWLNAKLDGMNVRWRDIRALCLSVFAVNFGPLALTNAPKALDFIFGIR